MYAMLEQLERQRDVRVVGRREDRAVNLQLALAACLYEAQRCLSSLHEMKAGRM